MAAYRPRGPTTALRQLRVLAGLSREELAEQAGVSVSAVINAERGGHIYLTTARGLTKVLGVGLDAAFPNDEVTHE
jgi:transcriptional regulator with XRE-family HTH domain